MFAQPVAGAFDVDDDGMVQQAVEQGGPGAGSPWRTAANGSGAGCVEVRRQEQRVAALASDGPQALSAAEKERLMALGDDVETAWTHPAATAETRKGIVRAVLEQVVVRLADDRIELLLHSCGGDHTRLNVPRARTGEHRRRTDA